MKKIVVPKHIQKYFIIAFVVVSLGIGGFFVTRNILQHKQDNKTLRYDIENVYYYMKQKTKDLYLFSNLKQGDSVALSAWHNTQSTTASQLKNYEKMFKNHQNHSSHFKEAVLIPEIQEYLDDFSKIASYISLRISSSGEFSEEQYQSMKQEMDEKLGAFAEKVKKYNLDLR